MARFLLLFNKKSLSDSFHFVDRTGKNRQQKMKFVEAV